MWFSTLTLISYHVILEVGMITVLYHIQAFSEMRLETICTVCLFLTFYQIWPPN